MKDAARPCWAIRVNGIADAELFGFTADGWDLRHGNPAGGSLHIWPQCDGKQPTHGVAQFIADVMAFDHDAPIDAAPLGVGALDQRIADPDAAPPVQPVSPLSRASSIDYWENVKLAHAAAAGNRFGGDSYVLRYDESDRAPSTEFSARFDVDQRHRLGLYAMATRQADLLSEYLCLYRVLESADGKNGVEWTSSRLDTVASHNFGELLLVEYVFLGRPDDGKPTGPITHDVFSEYQGRAADHIEDLLHEGADVPRYLYDLRNGIAHGKANTIIGSDSYRLADVGRALPIVKLLARLAIEP